jgi:hypothetical protein
MTVLYKVGDRIEGKKIICQFGKCDGPHKISTRGRHNAQQIKAEGNPALAVIDKQFDWVD